MTKRRALFLGLLLALLAPVALVAGQQAGRVAPQAAGGAAPPPDANIAQHVAPPHQLQQQQQQQDQAERVAIQYRPPPPPPPPPPGGGPPGDLTLHEWGVWRIQQGHVDHLQDLAAEVPAFVQRTGGLVAGPMPLLPQPPQPGSWQHPGVITHPMVARKPVIFLRATRPTRVQITVGFRGGAPWLYFPAALPTTIPGGDQALVFSGSVQPIGRTTLPAAPRGSWWNGLRAAGGQLFLGDQGSAEKFIFYDGPVDFEPAFRIARQGAGAVVTPVAGEHVVWLVAHGQFNRIEVPGDASTAHVAAQGTVTELRTQLRAELLARHLTDAEADALLDTWRDDLFVAPSARAIYFEPRAQYDAMLPITVQPTPVDMVRVGVVIELLP